MLLALLKSRDASYQPSSSRLILPNKHYHLINRPLPHPMRSPRRRLKANLLSPTPPTTINDPPLRHRHKRSRPLLPPTVFQPLGFTLFAYDGESANHA